MAWIRQDSNGESPSATANNNEQGFSISRWFSETRLSFARDEEYLAEFPKILYQTYMNFIIFFSLFKNRRKKKIKICNCKFVIILRLNE